MTDDLRAAAERLLDGRLKLEELQGPTGDESDLRAAIILARAYLAEHPTDDDEWAGEAAVQDDGNDWASLLKKLHAEKTLMKHAPEILCRGYVGDAEFVGIEKNNFLGLVEQVASQAPDQDAITCGEREADEGPCIPDDMHYQKMVELAKLAAVQTPPVDPREELRKQIVRTDHGPNLVVLELGGNYASLEYCSKWSWDIAGRNDSFETAESKEAAIAAAEVWLIDEAMRGANHVE